MNIDEAINRLRNIIDEFESEATACPSYKVDYDKDIEALKMGVSALEVEE